VALLVGLDSLEVKVFREQLVELDLLVVKDFKE
jgi:hypothetical protein